MLLGHPAFATDTPAPPASPMNRLVKQLTEKKAAEAATKKPARKEDLLKPEFQFKPGKDWLLLPDLAKNLTTNDAEREAIYTLLDQGALETRKALAAEDAANDIAVATVFFMTQLWGVVRQQEVAEADVDVLHAQLVAVLAGPDVGKMSDADKQRYWEFCIGFPIFVLGMKEIATEAEAQADLRKIASAGFESLIGVKPELVDLGAKGMVVRAGVEEAARQLQEEKKGGGSGESVSGINYEAPAGWTKEQADWATIYRATLRDVNNDGKVDANSDRQHSAAIFVMPPRAAPQGGGALFDAIWREQFGPAFELGDTVVHYRSRLKCGLVVHYMGRFFARKGGNQGAQTYGVLYLIDLGDRVQPLTATVVPGHTQYSMLSMDESAAMGSLSHPLWAVLQSIAPVSGKAPYPAGGFFAPADLQGDWSQSSSAFGGFYVNTMTGMGAGVATTSSGGSFRLGKDGTYDYSFAYASTNPQFGNSSGSTKHGGRYRLDGDIVLVEPSKPINYQFTCCAVGIGTRQTAAGQKRILVTVSANRDGVFNAPPLIPNWDSYSGTLSWYVEK